MIHSKSGMELSLVYYKLYLINSLRTVKWKGEGRRVDKKNLFIYYL